MLQVIVGVILTAILGGLLVPTVKQYMDRKRARLDAAIELLDVLATGLWTYWSLAHRVAYYAQQGDRSTERYTAALSDWDSADAWTVGRNIRIQLSRAKRLIPESYQPTLDDLDQGVIQGLDEKVEHLRGSGSQADWEQFFHDLMYENRAKIESILD
jgi:hypothetical protein